MAEDRPLSQQETLDILVRRAAGDEKMDAETVAVQVEDEIAETWGADDREALGRWGLAYAIRNRIGLARRPAPAKGEAEGDEKPEVPELGIVESEKGMAPLTDDERKRVDSFIRTIRGGGRRKPKPKFRVPGAARPMMTRPPAPRRGRR